MQICLILCVICQNYSAGNKTLSKCLCIDWSLLLKCIPKMVIFAPQHIS